MEKRDKGVSCDAEPDSGEQHRDYLTKGHRWVVAGGIIALLVGISAGFLITPAAASPPDADPPAPPVNDTTDENVSDTLLPADEVEPAGDTPVTIIATATSGNASITETLIADNGTVEHQYGAQIQATVPQHNISTLGADPAIAAIREPREPSQAQDDFVSEGLDPINAQSVHDADVTGANTTVAVIDFGFNPNHSPIADDVVETRDFTGDGISAGSTTHGDGTAEIVADVAPDTELILVSINTGVEFATAAEWINQHDEIDVAVASLGYYSYPQDGSSIVGDAIEPGAQSDTTWVVAAGNHGDGTHWYDTELTSDEDLVEFEDGDTCNWVVTEQSFTATLQWDDWDNTDQRYGLAVYEYDPASDEFSGRAISNENQLLGFPPWEQVSVLGTGGERIYCITAFADTTDEEVTLDLFLRNSPSPLEYASPERSVTVPATHPDVLAVGAANWWSGEIAPYSSRGPTIDGRQKPDISAPTAVSTDAYGEVGYFGTSAAAPHGAGAAALLAGQNGSLTAPAITNALTETAQPTAGSGVESEDLRYPGGEVFVDSDLPNTQVGAGLIDVEAAVASVTDDDPTVPDEAEIEIVSLDLADLTDPTDGADVPVAVNVTNADGDANTAAKELNVTLTIDSSADRTVYTETIEVGALNEETAVTFGEDEGTPEVGPLAAGEYEATAEVVAANAQTVRTSASFRVSEPPEEPTAEEFIIRDDAENIENVEVFDAIDAFRGDRLEAGELFDVIDAFREV